MRRPKAKMLVLARHAHRDKPERGTLDNGLSKKGRRQAKALARSLSRHLKGRDVRIVSSPLKRCVETARPIAKLLGAEVECSNLLLEDGDTLSEGGLDERVKLFAREWRAARAPVIIAIGHGDWIPRCVEILANSDVTLRKGGWAQIESAGRSAQLSWVVQEPGEFFK